MWPGLQSTGNKGILWGPRGPGKDCGFYSGCSGRIVGTWHSSWSASSPFPPTMGLLSYLAHRSLTSLPSPPNTHLIRAEAGSDSALGLTRISQEAEALKSSPQGPHHGFKGVPVTVSFLKNGSSPKQSCSSVPTHSFPYSPPAAHGQASCESPVSFSSVCPGASPGDNVTYVQILAARPRLSKRQRPSRGVCEREGSRPLCHPPRCEERWAWGAGHGGENVLR